MWPADPWRFLRHSQGVFKVIFLTIKKLFAFFTLDIGTDGAKAVMGKTACALAQIQAHLFSNHSSTIIIFYWSIIALYCCVSFCCTMKWISYMYTYIPCLLNLPLASLPATPLGHHRAQSWAPCVIQQLPANCLIHGGVCMSILITFSSHPSSPPASTCPFCAFASLFLPCRLVHLYYFFRFHMHLLKSDVCFSVADWLPSVWQTLGPSISLPMTILHFF